MTTALYRRYRPENFAEVIGQEHVTGPLRQALRSGQVNHAYLFSGPRGCGKTSSARILARILNCVENTPEHPTDTPCGVCASCVELSRGGPGSLDVVEIDAASHGGVDDARELRERATFAPARDRFKIFILDEAHMVTPQGFNALLKIVEEPPPHVKFVFATTEVHKVPVTILSRCQRYDFKLIGAGAIAKRLRYVLDQENIEADDAALSLMAREAAGSMRDGMSLLDQAIAWGGNKLVGEEIARVLGVAGHGTLHDLAAALVHGDAPGCLKIVGQLADQGFDLLQVARDMLEHLRDLVVVKICQDPERLTELTPDELQRVRQLVEGAGIDDLLRLHQGFSRGFDQMAYAPQQRSALEMLLVRLAMRPPLLPLDDILQRLGDLDKRLAARAGSSGAASPRGGARGWQRDAAVATRAVAAAAVLPSAERDESLAPAARVTPVESRPQAALQPVVQPAPEPSVQPEPEPAELDEQTLGAWREIIALLGEQNAGLASVLEHVVPVRVTPREVRLGIEQGSFYEVQLRDDKSIDLLTRVVRGYFHAATEVSLAIDGPAPSARRTLYDVEEQERRQRLALERRALEQHPLVRTAVEKLGARILDIKIK